MHHGIRLSLRHLKRLIKNLVIKQRHDASNLRDVVSALNEETSKSGDKVGYRQMTQRFQTTWNLFTIGPLALQYHAEYMSNTYDTQSNIDRWVSGGVRGFSELKMQGASSTTRRRRNERFIYLAIFYEQPRPNITFPNYYNLPNKILTFNAFIYVFNQQFKYFLLEAAALMRSLRIQRLQQARRNKLGDCDVIGPKQQVVHISTRFDWLNGQKVNKCADWSKTKFPLVHSDWSKSFDHKVMSPSTSNPGPFHLLQVGPPLFQNSAFASSAFLEQKTFWVLIQVLSNH